MSTTVLDAIIRILESPRHTAKYMTCRGIVELALWLRELGRQV